MVENSYEKSTNQEDNIFITSKYNNEDQQQMNNETFDTNQTNEDITTDPMPILDTSTTNSVANLVNENEEQKLLNENNYKIDENIVQVFKYILIAIFIKDITVFVQSLLFIFTKYYLYGLYTSLAFVIPPIILSIFFYKWDQATLSTKYVLKEFIYYNKHKKYKNCKSSIHEFEKSFQPKSLYRTVVKNIEDLRYYTLVNALIHGSCQMMTQIIFIYLKAYDNIYTLLFQIGLIIYSVVLLLLCVWIYRAAFCDFKNELGIYRANAFMCLLVALSCILYVLDIITDLSMFVKYCTEENYIRGTLTLIFIIAPGVYNYWHERCFREKKTLKIRLKNIIAILVNFSPVKGYLKSLKLILNTRKAELEDDEKGQIVNYQEYVQINMKVASSRYIECFTESCCQIIIQLSFLLSWIRFTDLTNEWINIGSSVISVLNVAIALVLFFRSKRIKKYEEDPFPISAIIIHFIGYLPVASRLLALSFMASVLPYWTCLYMFVHWLGIFIWILRYSTFSIPLFINNAGQALIYTYIAAINSVCVEIIFHFIFFVENIFALLLWNIYKYGYITTNGIYLLILTIILPSVIGWICRYIYRKYYDMWIEEYNETCKQRNFMHC